MSNVQRSSRLIAGRKRKMMLVLPVLVLPFITMAFWALGGGQGKASTAVAEQKGLNLNLPDSKLKDDDMADKLSFYDKADKDSAKKEEWMRADPYYQQRQDSMPVFTNELEQLTQSTASKYNQRLNTSPYETSGNNAEQKLMQKLALLQNELNKPQDAKSNEESYGNQTNADTEFSGEINRLENMMQLMNKTDVEDPEMKQLNGTLEKILDVQHPQRVKDKLKEKSLRQKEVVFAVSKTYEADNISLLDTAKKRTAKNTGFFGLDDNQQDAVEGNSIEAVVNANQVLVNGAVIQLRFVTDVFINGILIPKGNQVSGIASLNNERLEAEINSIRFGSSLFPVKLEIYDMDGLPGIYIPGSMSREVGKQSADNSLQLMELTSMDPTMKAQMAAAGVNTVKSLLSKKVRQVKVMVKAGYKVLLKDKNTTID